MRSKKLAEPLYGTMPAVAIIIGQVRNLMSFLIMPLGVLKHLPLPPMQTIMYLSMRNESIWMIQV